MLIWILFGLATSVTYILLLEYYRKWWHVTSEWTIPSHWQPSRGITVLIAARNEAAGIGPYLEKILACDYPPVLREVIVVDDFSSDATADIASRILVASRQGGLSDNNRVIRLEEMVDLFSNTNAFKKRAIEIGLSFSAGEIAVLTDADCEPSREWLNIMVSALETEGVQLAAGPVLFHRERSIFEKFQSLDFAGMMAITAGGITSGFQRMGNGANLAYWKQTFEAVDGYRGSENRASGDDLFLIQKIAARFPNSIKFVKSPDAVVFTHAKPTVGGFISQRLRWATKNAALPEVRIRLALAVVWLHCLLILINAIFSFVESALIALFMFQLIAKGFADYRLLHSASLYFRRRDLMQVFLPSFLLHIFYIAGIGTAGLFVRRYLWKGRKVK